MLKKIHIYLTFIFLMIPALVFGNGFTINEQSARAIGMGGAFVAQADSAEAVYYNPAGITQINGTDISFGLAAITPYATFEQDGGGTYDATEMTHYVPSFFYTQKLNDKFTAGVGLFANFGLATKWSEDFPGRYLVGGRYAKIETLSLNPVIAYKVTDKLSLSFGPVIQKIRANISNNFNHPLLPDGDSMIYLNDLEDVSWGWVAAAHYKMNEQLRFGATFRSQIDHKLHGVSETQGLDSDGALSSVYTTYNQNISAEMNLPAIATFGIAYDINKLTLAADAQWTQWSQYKILQSDELGLVKGKHWKDAWTYRFGAEYDLTEKHAIRAGIVRDMSPIPAETIDPMLPSGDRWLYTVGYGYNAEKWSVDLAYNYLIDEGGRFDNAAGDSAFKSLGVSRITGNFKDVTAQIFQVNFNLKF